MFLKALLCLFCGLLYMFFTILISQIISFFEISTLFFITLSIVFGAIIFVYIEALKEKNISFRRLPGLLVRFKKGR